MTTGSCLPDWASGSRAAGGGGGRVLAPGRAALLDRRDGLLAFGHPQPETQTLQMVLTFLDHLSEVGLSKHFGHPEDHESVLGVDQIRPQGPIEKHLEELGVHEQVLLDEGFPVREGWGQNRTGSKFTRSS